MKKPVLRIVDVNEVDKIDKLFEALTGKKMTKQERAYAEVKLAK